MSKKIKNLKVFNLKTLAPYVLAIGVCVGIPKVLGAGLPFYKDEKTAYLQTKTTMTSDGLITEDSNYATTPISTDVTVKQYRKCEIGENGYVREVKTYDIGKMDKTDIDKLLKQKDASLDDVLGSPLSVETIKVGNTDIKDSYIEITYWEEDKENRIVIKESDFSNNLTTIFSVGSILTSCCVIYMIQKGNAKTDEEDKTEETPKSYILYTW